ncbi:HAD family hydrolase [Halalkaliarchaeum sp. AArc-GB]|uniref:HAD family hydrolase n=1 Tax=Halalkaliarchaeum sp. AArc-GB TaxID=3074078 RepID=UPI00286572B1|nr:HAD family hydrolase [Halalkaliarchaeum sp. AArc-GB]MDR5672293.1 HAD family hydrolase [Halalkaliarchaeum sp. AArc-GB]
MERYDLLYRLYDEFDTETLREYQDFVDLFPPVDSRVALDHWQDANDELDRRKEEIRTAFPSGGVFAEVAARADRESAFTALDLLTSYDRALNALVLDVDETLRSAGGTDNEIPRDTLHVLTEFHEAGVPIVICTGQTLENVKGFMIQGLGNEIVHSGKMSIVYEAGTGVFTPGHGSRTKQLLYEDLDEGVRSVFDEIRSRVLPDAPEEIRRGCHLQGNEFNVTLKPNFETGSDRAEAVIDSGVVYLLDLLGEAVATHVDGAGEEFPEHHTEDGGLDPGPAWARAFYADADPEVREVLETERETSSIGVDDVPDPVRALFERIDVAYYHADAAEIGSLELNKVAGVEAALDVLEIEDPFVLVMGDSKSDLRVMRWAEEHDTGIAAAPAHASTDVLEHVMDTDDLVFEKGQSASLLRTAFVMNLLARIE